MSEELEPGVLDKFIKIIENAKKDEAPEIGKLVKDCLKSYLEARYFKKNENNNIPYIWHRFLFDLQKHFGHKIPRSFVESTKRWEGIEDVTKRIEENLLGKWAESDTRHSEIAYAAYLYAHTSFQKEFGDPARDIDKTYLGGPFLEHLGEAVPRTVEEATDLLELQETRLLEAAKAVEHEKHDSSSLPTDHSPLSYNNPKPLKPAQTTSQPKLKSTIGREPQVAPNEATQSTNNDSIKQILSKDSDGHNERFGNPFPKTINPRAAHYPRKQEKSQNSDSKFRQNSRRKMVLSVLVVLCGLVTVGFLLSDYLPSLITESPNDQIAPIVDESPTGKDESKIIISRPDLGASQNGRSKNNLKERREESQKEQDNSPSKADVRKIQIALKNTVFPRLGVDGEDGPKTKKVVDRYLKYRQLTKLRWPEKYEEIIADINSNSDAIMKLFVSAPVKKTKQKINTGYQRTAPKKSNGDICPKTGFTFNGRRVC